jgi:hypothetical protein
MMRRIGFGLGLAFLILAMARILVGGVGVWGLFFPTEAPLALYLDGHQMVIGQPIKLSDPAAKVLFEDFRKARYFAAFAADDQGH